MNITALKSLAPGARWQALSLRERRMVTVAVLAVAAFVYAYGLALPMARWAESAQSRHQRAIAGAAELDGVLTALSALPAAVSSPAPEALASSASALGLQVDSVRGEAEGGARIALAPAAPELVFAWIEQRRLAGQPPRSVRIEAREDGVVAELDF